MKHLLYIIIIIIINIHADEHVLNTFYSDQNCSIILVKHIKYKMNSSFEKFWLKSMTVRPNKLEPEKQTKLRITYSKLKNKLILLIIIIN